MYYSCAFSGYHTLGIYLLLLVLIGGCGVVWCKLNGSVLTMIKVIIRGRGNSFLSLDIRQNYPVVHCDTKNKIQETRLVRGVLICIIYN